MKYRVFTFVNSVIYRLQKGNGMKYRHKPVFHAILVTVNSSENRVRAGLKEAAPSFGLGKACNELASKLSFY